MNIQVVVKEGIIIPGNVEHQCLAGRYTTSIVGMLLFPVVVLDKYNPVNLYRRLGTL